MTHRAAGRRLAVPAVLALALLAPATVLAHLALESSEPADGATVTEIPQVIVLTFTQALGAASEAELRDSSGAVLAAATIDAADPTRLVIDPPDLVAGTYEIRWTVRGADGHIERGVVAFRHVSPPSATPDATASRTVAPTSPSQTTTAPPPTATPTAPPDDSGATGGLDVLLPIGLGLALAAILAVRLLRRGSSDR